MNVEDKWINCLLNKEMLSQAEGKINLFKKIKT